MALILKTQRDLRATPHREGVSFQCGDCKEVKPVNTQGGGTGYGYATDTPEAPPICYACCSKRENDLLVREGKGYLYLTSRTMKPGNFCDGEVGNWPGGISFKCRVKSSFHNIAGVRYDVWFTGPDGQPWWGVQYGNMTQVCRVRRVKRA